MTYVVVELLVVTYFVVPLMDVIAVDIIEKLKCKHIQQWNDLPTIQTRYDKEEAEIYKLNRKI